MYFENLIHKIPVDIYCLISIVQHTTQKEIIYNMITHPHTPKFLNLKLFVYAGDKLTRIKQYIRNLIIPSTILSFNVFFFKLFNPNRNKCIPR